MAGQVLALDVADEVEVGLVEELGRLLDPEVALALLLADRQERDRAGRSTPRTRSLKIEPIRAYWARFSGLESGFAPMSRRTSVPASVISWTARAGRSTPGRRPRRRTAAAIPAPVWPAVTTRVGLAALHEVGRDEDRRVLLLAERHRRVLVHPDDLGGVDDRDVGRELAGDRADRRLVADEDHPVLGVGAGVIEGAGDDLGRAVVAAHRVDRDRHPAAVIAGRAGRRRDRAVERGDHLRRRCRSRSA